MDSHSQRIAGYRSRKKGPAPLSGREKLIISTIGLAVVMPPWFLGGMLWWQQLIFLGLALIPLLLALAPSESWSFGRQAKRLLGFPVFWLTGLFLTYIIIGYYNNAWEITPYVKGQKLRLIESPEGDFIPWLPHGLQSPFFLMNTWRVVINITACLALVSAVWLGLSRRRSVIHVLSIIALNAFLIAILGILQELSETRSIYWTFKSANFNHFGPFQYRNHGAIYEYLGLACCLAVIFYYRGRAALVKSTPTPLFAFFAFMIFIGIIMAGSRGGILFGSTLLVFALFLFAIQALQSGIRGFIAMGFLTVLFMLSVVLVYPVLEKKLPELRYRLKQTEQTLSAGGAVGNDVEKRFMLNKVTLEMWKERPWLGWGAGSYRFFFPSFQKQYREFYYTPYSIKRNAKYPRFKLRRQLVYYTHNDWVQAVTEYGVIGAVLLSFSLLYWLILAIRKIAYFQQSTLILYAGCCLVLIHAFFDFPLWNPPSFFPVGNYAGISGETTYV